MNSYLSRYFEMSNSPWSIGVLIGSMYGMLKNQPNVHKYTDTWELRHLLSRWYKYTIFPWIFWHPTNLANQNVIGALDKNKDWANRSGDVDISGSMGEVSPSFIWSFFKGSVVFLAEKWFDHICIHLKKMMMVSPELIILVSSLSVGDHELLTGLRIYFWLGCNKIDSIVTAAWLLHCIDWDDSEILQTTNMFQMVRRR